MVRYTQKALNPQLLLLGLSLTPYKPWLSRGYCFPANPLNLMSSDITHFPSMLQALMLPEDLSISITYTVRLGLF